MTFISIFIKEMCDIQNIMRTRFQGIQMAVPSVVKNEVNNYQVIKLISHHLVYVLKYNTFLQNTQMC